MRRVMVGVGVAMLACAGWPVGAGADPVSGPHETIDNQFTTTQPHASTGFHFTGSYHAAGDPSGDPPYLRKMVSILPAGGRFDTSVPERCGASDLELAVQGAAACPPGSRIGGGTVQGKFLGFPSTLQADLLNNTDEQIIVTRSPAFASVSRGKIGADGSVEFASPTCYPALNPPGCPADDALQLGSDIVAPPHGGYLTTPLSCPRSGHWDMPFTFYWADGTVDTVVTHQACVRRSR
jgi:hypothetical protein